MNYFSIIILDIIVQITILLIVKFIKENNKNKENIPKSYIIECLKMIKNNKVLIYFLSIDFITAFSLISIENFYSTFLSNKCISTFLVGFIMAFQFLISAILGVFITNKLKRKHKTFIFLSFSTLQWIFLLLIYLINLPTIIISLCFVANLLCGTIFGPIKFEMFQNNIDKRLRATTISVRSLAISLGGILSYSIISTLGKYMTLNTITVILLIITLTIYSIINILITSYLK